MELRLSSGPDSTPRTDFYVLPTEREKKREKNTHLQSGTNRIIQEMAAVCTGAAKIRLLLKSQWAAVTVFRVPLEEAGRHRRCLCCREVTRSCLPASRPLTLSRLLAHSHSSGSFASIHNCISACSLCSNMPLKYSYSLCERQSRDETRRKSPRLLR